MKKTLFLVFCFSCFLLRAQTPQKIGYQAVVRDERGDLVTNRNVGVRITILQNGMEVYQETHTPQTNANGLFSIEIGNGAVLHGVFGAIEWSESECSVKTDIDLMGGTSYTLTSTTETLSIPYAMHAQTAQRLVENPQESDPIFVASVAKNITDTNVQYWNKKLDSADLEVLKIEVQTKVDSAYVNAKLQNLEIGVDTALLNMLKSEIEALKKTVEDLQIVNGTLVKDIDGNIYKTQKYGNQTWMIENLRVSKYNDGTPIDCVQDKTEWVNKQTIEDNSYVAPPMFCIKDALPEDVVKYGFLYNWYAAKPANGKEICPTGWHVPSYSEWITLLNKLIADGYNYDGTTNVNKLAKSMATGNWNYSNIAGSPGNTDYPEKKNTTNFSGYPIGWRSYNGEYERVGTGIGWWASTSTYTYSMLMGQYAAILLEDNYLTVCNPGTMPVSAKSIRCVKN